MRGLAAAVGLSLLAAARGLELWRADLGVPWSYELDALHNLMVVGSLIENGWYLTNDSLGAPFGQDLRDFPVVAGDVVHLVLLKLIGWITGDVAATVNLFFLLTFPLTAALAYLVLRRLEISTWPAVAAAVVYAVAPYHFFRGEVHLFLAGYFAVPVGGWIALSVMTGRTVGPPVLLLAAGALVGLSEAYYAVFSIAFITLAVAFALFKRRRRAALEGAIACAAILAAAGAAHVPTLLGRAGAPANLDVERLRDPSDSNLFALRPARLVLPVEGHRIGPLADLTAGWAKGRTQLEEGPPQALGVTTALGAVGGLLALLAMALARRRDTARLRLPAACGGLIASAVALGVEGGIGPRFASTVSDAVRSWNRVSVFIAFFGVVVVAWALEWAAERLRARTERPGTLTVLGLVLVVGLATLDQSSARSTPDYERIGREWRSDRDFIRAVDRALPSRAMVFQLPWSPFPEYGYGLARGFIHDADLRWSWGAVLGTPADWQSDLAGKPGPLALAGAAAAGFQGLYVDIRLYGQAAEGVLPGIAEALDTQPSRSADGRLWFFDLRPFAQRLRRDRSQRELAALRESVLRPVEVRFGAAFGALIPYRLPPAFGRYSDLYERDGTIVLHNPRARPVAATFSARLRTARPGAVAVRWPDGSSTRIADARVGTEVRKRVTLASGANVVRIRSAAAPFFSGTEGRDAYLRVEDWTLTDPVQERFRDGLAS